MNQEREKEKAETAHPFSDDQDALPGPGSGYCRHEAGKTHSDHDQFIVVARHWS